MERGEWEGGKGRKGGWRDGREGGREWGGREDGEMGEREGGSGEEGRMERWEEGRMETWERGRKGVGRKGGWRDGKEGGREWEGRKMWREGKGDKGEGVEEGDVVYFSKPGGCYMYMYIVEHSSKP